MTQFIFLCNTVLIIDDFVLTGYRPVSSGSAKESPSAMLNFDADQDEADLVEGTQPPPSTQETQGDAGQEEGRDRRAVRRYSPSPIMRYLKKKSKKGAGGPSRG